MENRGLVGTRVWHVTLFVTDIQNDAGLFVPAISTAAAKPVKLPVQANETMLVTLKSFREGMESESARHLGLLQLSGVERLIARHSVEEGRISPGQANDHT